VSVVSVDVHVGEGVGGDRASGRGVAGAGRAGVAQAPATHTAYWQIGFAYAFIGIGVGFAGTPASHSLTGSVPVQRSGMASGTADLQRDLGGAILQSIFGALLTAGYAAAVSAMVAASPNGQQITSNVQNALTKSFSSAADIVEQYPQYAPQIIDGAKSSFLSGADWAYTAGLLAILLGAALVFFLFPKKEHEQQLLAAYAGEDAARRAVASKTDL
jgi:DHA2 family multidrug resistance protein-like MFS transporter